MIHCRQLLGRMGRQLKDKYKRDDKMWEDLDRMREEREDVVREYMEMEEQRKHKDSLLRGIVCEEFTDNESNYSRVKADTRPRTNTQPGKQRTSHTYTRAPTNLKTDTIESVPINHRQRRVSTTTDIRGRSTASKWNFKSKRHI